MNVIDTLIFDRTNSDIINKTDKAYIDYNDLNRIEEACTFVASEIGVSIQTKTWLISDFRTEAEMERLRNNIALLKNSYYSMQGSPPVPYIINFKSITQANNIEKILYDIDVMFKDVLSGKPRLAFRLGTKNLGNRR